MKHSLLCIALIFPKCFLSQIDSELTISPSDSNQTYLINYANQLSLKLFGISKSNQIRHFDNWTKRFVDYRPNENYNVGVGVGHKWLNLDLALSLPFINDDDELFGKTKRFDIQANMYLNRFTIDLNYQPYKGYYGFNPQHYIDDFDRRNPVYPIRPDISTFNTAVNVLYNFKPEKFSYRAAFTYNERQVKSAGSWLVGSFLSYFEMNADSTIVPFQERDEFNPEADFRGAKYVNTGVSGGYGHTFVIKKKWFISMTLVMGLGPSFITFPERNGTPSNKEVKFAIRAVARAALGYNGEKLFGGISSISSASSEVDEEEAYLSRMINNIKVFVGIRIAPPEWFEKH